MDKIDKILNPGKSKCGEVFFHITYAKGKLSISGVVNPQINGNCTSCGQIYGEKIFAFNEGWNIELLSKFYQIWEEWHLNDMKAGCVHQKEWEKRPIDPSKPLNSYGKHFENQKLDSWNMLTWVYPTEHPEGLLTKPCPTCGYKYGTSWLFEEVPEEVINFLDSLPESKLIPAWI